MNMGTYNIRLGSMLSFDEEQEKDIIKAIEYLNATHSTGRLMSNLIRIAFDNPEILDIENGKFEKGAIVKQLDTLGVSHNRNVFFTNLAKEVEVMKKKVDKIYDMSMKTYMLAQMGKHLALESKSDNHLMAGFVLEKQLKELQDALGVTPGSTPFESNKLENAHKRAEDALEYIIETYDDILSELKNQFELKQLEVPVQAIDINNIKPYDNIPLDTAKESTTISDMNNTLDTSVNTNVSNVSSQDSDELIDFGNDDFEATDALANFFNI